MKRFLGRILLCVIPVVVSIFVVGWAYAKYQNGEGGFHLGVDLSGGTILVYEVDLSKMTQQARDAFKAEDLAASLKRRIDPADLYNVTIRPIPGDPPRVEIILPTGGRQQVRAAEAAWQGVIDSVKKQYPDLQGVSFNDIPQGQYKELVDRVVAAHPKKDGKDIEPTEISNFIYGLQKDTGKRHTFTGEEIENIKNLIQQQGRLEFRILANDRDDSAASKAALDYMKDPKNKPELDRLNANGDAPPPPTQNGAPNGDRYFTVNLHDETLRYEYSWVEVGKQELYTLQLNSAAERTSDADLRREERRQRIWGEVNQTRDKEAFVDPGYGGILLYSRTILDPQRVSSRDRELGKKVEYFVLTRETERGHEVTGDFLTSVGEGQAEGKRAVDFSFNSEGANRFLELTTLNQPTGGSDPNSQFHRLLAVILDNAVQSAPQLNAVISGRGQITGDFTPKEVEDLVRILRAGALPATLKSTPVSETTLGATLGEDTIFKGTVSVALAFAAVLIFMLIYYRFAGVVACIALLANLLLTVAFMVLVQATFTLPGLAGLVLMLGMAVDANVLIYERLREERERGASLALAVRNGYDRAFPTIIDTHLTSIFTAIVLYVVGNDQLKGFGISLTVGLIISLFTSLFVTRTIFDIWLGNNWLHKLTFMQLFKRPNIDFMRIRHLMFGLTVGFTVLGAALFIYHLFNGGLNIDFVGGTAYSGLLVKPVGLTELRDKLEPDRNALKEQDKRDLGVPGDLPDVSIAQEFPNDPTLVQGDKSAVFTVRTSDQNRVEVQKIVNFKLGDLLKRIDMKDPVIEVHNKKAREATLSFVKSKDDFSPDQVKPVLAQDLGVQEKDLQLGEAEGKGDFYVLRMQAPVGEKPESDVKAALEKTRDDLRGKGIEMVKAPEVQVKDGTATATLKFAKPQPDYASPAQVTLLLNQVFQKLDVQKFKLEPAKDAESHEGRFSEMVLTLDDPIPADDLKAALETVKTDFQSTPQPERLENFDSQLARDTQQKALYAILASWVAILLYLWFRFGSWTFGAATVLCLIHDLFFTLGAIALCHYIYVWAPGVAYYLGIADFKIDLTSVAALLTLVGYSVSDTIVVFDRIREVRGKNPLLTYTMINDSVNQTLSRTILSSLTVFLVVGVLYVFGGEGVHLFSFVMVIGVIVGTYSSIYIASPLLFMLGVGAPRTERDRAAAAAAADAAAAAARA